jgi:thymidylate kinase
MIFEGPDGGGKSTAAKAFAEKTGATYVHHGPYTGENYITHHYLDSMVPALSGVCDVILDRCWISEPIYGAVHRNGKIRVSDTARRFLEHTAATLCVVKVLIYLPPYDVCLANFNRRRGQEYLDSARKLRAVYDLYNGLSTTGFSAAFSVKYVDYTKELANGK